MMVKFVDLEHLQSHNSYKLLEIDNYISYIIDNNVTKQNKYIPEPKYKLKI